MSDLRVDNGSGTTYIGCAQGFIPINQTQLQMFNFPTTPLVSTYDDLLVDYEIGGVPGKAHAKIIDADGRKANLYMTAPGSWQPGATELNITNISADTTGATRPIVADLHGSQYLNTYVVFRYHTTDNPTIRSRTIGLKSPEMMQAIEKSYGNAGFLKGRASFSLSGIDALSAVGRLELTPSFFAEEHGARLRVAVSNTGRNRSQKGTPDASIYIDSCMLVCLSTSAHQLVRTHAAANNTTPEALIEKHAPTALRGEYTSTLATAYDDLIPDAVASRVIVVDGKRKGTVKIDGLNTSMQITELWSPSGAVAQGSPTPEGRWADAHRPGNDVDTNHDAESAQFVCIEAGGQLFFDVLLGSSPDRPTHDQLTSPTLISWSDPELYSDSFVVPIADHEEATTPMAKRFVDLISSNVSGANTIFHHRARGKYYRLPADENPMAGYRDHGGHHWNAGFVSSTHYNILGAYFQYAIGGLASDRGKWARLAYQGGVHALQEGVRLSDIMEQYGAEMTYEKGASRAGAYSHGTTSHSWIQGILLTKNMFFDLDAMRFIDAWYSEQEQYESKSGDAFPLAAANAGIDSRDWQWDSGINRYTDHTKSYINTFRPRNGFSNGGDQGTWGCRLIGWALEQAVWMHTIDLRDTSRITHLVAQIERLEGIWHEQGYYLNRGQRGKGYEDYAKPWMHLIVCKALLLAQRVTTFTIDQDAMVERFIAIAVKYVDTSVSTLMMAGTITVAGDKHDDLSRLRSGISAVTESYMFDAFDQSMPESLRGQAWQQFMTRLRAETADATYNTHLAASIQDDEWWDYPKLELFSSMAYQASSDMRELGVLALDDFAAPMGAMVRDVRRLDNFKGGLYVAQLADILCMRAMWAQSPTATEETDLLQPALETPVFYHQVLRSQPATLSPFGYSMGGSYPTVETKIWGALYNTPGMQNLLINRGL